ncbi:MAG: amidohydrolase family protein, partial [Desulfurococcaceae archaeon]
MFSILIIGGTIVDGFGNPPFEGCIGIEDDKIAFVGKLEECRGLDAKKVIEASNLFVSPGFIDLHSHFDETMLMYPSAECGLLQGITTAVGGNCGYSPAPLKKWWLWSFWEEEAIQRLYPYKYYPESAVVPLDEIKPLLRETLGLEINWSTFREYIDVLRATGIGVNIALQVGHNTIRAQVMGKDYKRKATTEEIREMKELVEEAMEAGAIGFSTGLDYEPGAYADTEEIIELAKVAAKYGGLYSTHWRRTGIRRGTSKLLPRKIEGIIEAIEVGRKAGIRVEISHLLPGYIVYPDNEELWRVSARETIKTIEKARESGLEIGFDVIPTETGGVFKIKYLASLLSPCIRDAGNLERLGNLLRAKDYRDEVKRNIQEGKIYSLNPFYITDLAKHITIVKSNVDGISGFTLYEVSEKLNKDIVDLILDLLSEDPTTE